MMKIKIAGLVNYLAATLLMVMGIIYLTKTSFMPYHGDAISLDWFEVEKNTRVLILALMRGVSGGLLSVSVTILYLQFKFTSTRLRWIPGLILIAGIILSATVLYAMLIIKSYTPGNPPFALTISGTVLLITGFYLNMKEIKKSD
jgi:uncharacterized membrane-anchored protein